MKYLISHGIEPERIRLSQSAAFEPLTTRLDPEWQNENNCVEIFLLTEVAGKTAGAIPTSEHTADVTLHKAKKP